MSSKITLTGSAKYRDREHIINTFKPFLSWRQTFGSRFPSFSNLYHIVVNGRRDFHHQFLFECKFTLLNRKASFRLSKYHIYEYAKKFTLYRVRIRNPTKVIADVYSPYRNYAVNWYDYGNFLDRSKVFVYCKRFRDCNPIT